MLQEKLGGGREGTPDDSSKLCPKTDLHPCEVIPDQGEGNCSLQLHRRVLTCLNNEVINYPLLVSWRFKDSSELCKETDLTPQYTGVGQPFRSLGGSNQQQTSSRFTHSRIRKSLLILLPSTYSLQSSSCNLFSSHHRYARIINYLINVRPGSKPE